MTATERSVLLPINTDKNVPLMSAADKRRVIEATQSKILREYESQYSDVVLNAFAQRIGKSMKNKFIIHLIEIIRDIGIPEFDTYSFNSDLADKMMDSVKPHLDTLGYQFDICHPPSGRIHFIISTEQHKCVIV